MQSQTHAPLSMRRLSERPGALAMLLAALLLCAGCATSSLPGDLLLLGVGATAHPSPVLEGPRRRSPDSASAQPMVMGGAGSIPQEPNATATRQAVLAALEDVSGSLRRTTDALARLEANPRGLLVQGSGLFSFFLEDAIQRRQWVSRTLSDVQRLVQTASEVEDPEMQLALLRLTGPRLEAALCGAQLLATWTDLLRLAEAVLPMCPPYNLEHLLRQTYGEHKKVESAMKALASLEPAQIEDTASALPGLMGELLHDFETTRTEVSSSEQWSERMLAAKHLMEGITLGLAVGMALPPGTSAAPAAMGAGLAMGSDGMMAGTQVVVSAEWLETMGGLVRAGVISVPVVSAAVRLHAGPMLMSQSGDELPKGVRQALGEGPEVRGMRQTGRAGAGMSEPPKHHVLPREHREWFEQRGFTGEMDIDQFCVEMEQAHHEAIHGGGDWRLGRQWPGEWNQMIMKALRAAEFDAGRMLTRREVLNLVAERMKDYGLAMDFVPWRGL